ncbi:MULTISPECIES: helix-turn-helix domain-containing protein [unclassified Paenibacillus]|uniref:helix-turn-helix domain-containing protein n=1 Tax=unclassified Paenibacillus TaxID=185978 RepID=UPI0024061404|nr:MULTISPECIES: helix-turn-helix domain-containing protein [unclassified Paenibacillus]MDF9843825.1 AraC-like DNA-binding protein [Paenibacillus sp. PastF-2]MDF9850491.1 AraC-like DNA-binding protein [Paenibacillus sp. PastM-2]MDF9857004.1 AraC-like DNA-binding protein [Paenibacillus sp. PastF-1]MDH6482276.1 AraC-like DNA-binding protein [Paenibacillus sp. PastH-2]MDH6509757.1 AraC-like DNA-binding protein [Paenibacillus sp. PastM-3]
MENTTTAVKSKGYKRIWAGRKGRYYRNNLIIVLIVSSIPGLIIGLLVYWMAGGSLEEELLEMHNRQIEQRAANIDDQLSNLELMLAHWAFDPKFDYSLKNMDFIMNHERAWDITKTLVVMQGSNSMARQVELYLAGDRPVLFNTEYGTVTSSGAAVYEKLMKTEQSTYWTELAFDPAKPQQKELTLVHHIPGGSLEPFGVLLLRMDTQKVSDMLRTMTPYNSGEVYMLRKSGGLFISGSGTGGAATPFVNSLQSAIEARGSGNSTSFLYDWDGVTYAVTYGDFSRIASEWLYVSASPISSITSPVVELSRTIIMVSLSALLLAAVLSWIASRKIYSPFRRLLQTLLPEHDVCEGREDEVTLIERHWQNLHGQQNALQYTLSEQLPHVQRSFLHQLFQGYLYAFSEQELQSRMKQYKWEVADCVFVVLYIQLTGISSLEGKFRSGDESLVSFAAVNIIGELAAEHFERAETVNLHNLTAGILLIGPGGAPETARVQAFGEELAATINRMLKLQATVAYSAPIDSISAIPRSFEAAKQAASHRRYGGGNQVVSLEQLEREGEGAHMPQYSFALERGLIQALRTGEAEEADRLLEEFLATLSADGAKVIDVQQGMLHLLGAVQHAVLEAGIAPNQLFKGRNLYAGLSQIHEPGMILPWFRDHVVSPFLKELSERSDAGIRRTIDQAMLYIQEHYMDNISLDSCADYTGTSPFLLSKSFKRVTGQNFIDYLTGLRIEKAKELLRDTDLKMNDVALQVGYQQSYFNRIFKKQEDITPTRYRELSRHEGQKDAETR